MVVVATLVLSLEDAQSWPVERLSWPLPWCVCRFVCVCVCAFEETEEEKALKQKLEELTKISPAAPKKMDRLWGPTSDRASTTHVARDRVRGTRAQATSVLATLATVRSRRHLLRPGPHRHVCRSARRFLDQDRVARAQKIA